MKKIRIISILTLMAFAVGSAQAQHDSTIYHESVIVVGDYTPVLDGVTEKVNVAPTVDDSAEAALLPTFSYSITSRRISSITPTTGLKAAKVIGSPTRLYNNYMRFGIGHDVAAFADFNPLMDLYYTSKRSDNMAYGARLFHETDVTSFGNADPVTPSADYYGRNRQTDTRMDIFGKYIFAGKHLINANLVFDRQYGRYYGFSDSTLFATHGVPRDSMDFSDYAFAYNDISINLGAKSLATDVNRFGYDASLGFDNMWGRWNFSQKQFDLDGAIHYGFPMLKKYKGIVYLRMNWQNYGQHQGEIDSLSGMPFGYSRTFDSTTADINRSLFTFNPYIDFLFKDFKIHAGFALGFNSFDDAEETTHNFFPDLTVSKSFMRNAMNITLGLQGKYIANDWNSIRMQNPYVEPMPDSRATEETDLYAHVRFNFSKKLILNVNLDNAFCRDRLFFMPSPNASMNHLFTTYYVNANCMTLAADFTFVNDEMITMTLGGEYYKHYGYCDSITLLYTPEYKIYFDTRVNYKNKWYFGIDAIYLSSVASEFNLTSPLHEETARLDARLGVSANVEYVHNRALSFFAKFDNITAQRWLLWANYPAQRFNFMIGLTYTIPSL